jgi:hypothetical protein
LHDNGEADYNDKPLFSVFGCSMLLSLVFLCSTLAFAVAQVTIYEQIALLTQTSTFAATSTSPAYNDTRLVPPAIPSPAPPNDFALTLEQNSDVVPGLSIPHVGSGFWGFSIEMSVISQIRQSSLLSSPN